MQAWNLSATTCHEVGHAMDHRLGYPSNFPSFVDSIPLEGQRGRLNQEKRSKYFHLLPSETWAELYSVVFDPAPRSQCFHCTSREKATTVYAEPIAVVKRLIQEELNWRERKRIEGRT